MFKLAELVYSSDQQPGLNFKQLANKKACDSIAFGIAKNCQPDQVLKLLRHVCGFPMDGMKKHLIVNARVIILG